MDILTLVFILFVGICIGILFSRLGISQVEKYARKDAVHTSRAVILGDIYEKILPSLPDFAYAPKDMVFVGKWVDYIIFDGLSEGYLKEIIFLELKSGKSRLNKNEQMIQDIVARKRVRYTEYRIGTVGKKV